SAQAGGRCWEAEIRARSVLLWLVIAGLDPAIHPFAKTFLRRRWTNRKRMYPISGASGAPSRVNPTCVVKPAGDGNTWEENKWLAARIMTQAYAGRCRPPCGEARSAAACRFACVATASR